MQVTASDAVLCSPIVCKTLCREAVREVAAGLTKRLLISVDLPFDRTVFWNDQVRLRGGDEELDRAERLIREFQSDNWTLETPVGFDDEVNSTPSYELVSCDASGDGDVVSKNVNVFRNHPTHSRFHRYDTPSPAPSRLCVRLSSWRSMTHDGRGREAHEKPSPSSLRHIESPADLDLVQTRP